MRAGEEAIASVAVIVFAASGLIRASSDAAGPWSPVPAGWVLLEGDGIDSWMATYHDRVSGVCIGFDVTFPGVVRPQPKSEEVPPPDYSGVPVHINTEPNRSCKGGRTAHASFFPQGDEGHSQVWNLSVSTCDRKQYARVREFLFGPGAGPSERPKNPDLGRLHKRAELEAVTVGRTYKDVRQELGATSYAECDADGGFRAYWTEDSRPHYRDWSFKFNRDQELVSMKRP